MPREYRLALAMVLTLVWIGCNTDSPDPKRPTVASPTAPSQAAPTTPATPPVVVPTLTGVTTDSEVAIQHVIRLTAGDTVTPLQLAPHDLSYAIGADRCYPFRLFRVIVPAAGTLHVSVTWTNAATLNLWSGGQFFGGVPREVAADVPVKTPGESVMYVGTRSLTGANGVYVPITIATTLQN